MGIAFPFICLWLVECCLLWTNVGIDSTLVLRSDRDPDGKTHYLNPRVDVAYCTADLRGPEPRGFELPKPIESLRVVVVGASSVQGYPYPSEIAFPRQMELVLQRQLENRNVEVLNAGIIGLSTTPLVDLVSQCTEASPSLVVLYAGHNEFYGVGGVATNAKISRIGIEFRRYRLGQVLSDYFSEEGRDDQEETSELITRLPVSYRIPTQSQLVREAEDTYRRNVARIARVCASHDIPLLVCSVVSNLRDQGPLMLPDESKIQKDVESTIAPLISEGDYETTCKLLSEVIAEHPEAASVRYRLAQCLEKLGEVEKASKAYTAARDLDPCRYRAPGSFGQILRQVTSEAGEEVFFLDLVPVFSQHSEYAAPGDDLFLEHVHFTLDGHWLVAKSIAKKIVEDVCDGPWDESRLPSEQERDDWLGLIPEDILVGHILALFISQTPPFDEAIDAEKHTARLAAKIKQITSRMPNQDLRAFASLDHKVQMDDLVDGLGRLWLGMGNTERALGLFERSTQRRPWMPNGQVFSAVCYHLRGRDAEAVRHLEASRKSVVGKSEALRRDEKTLVEEMR